MMVNSDYKYLITWVNRRAGNKAQLSWQKDTLNNEKEPTIQFEKTGETLSREGMYSVISFSENCHR